MDTHILDQLSELPGAHRYERYVAVICPYHEDHNPSCFAYPDGWFHCAACGAHGRVEQLLSKYKRFHPIIEKKNHYEPAIPDDVDTSKSDGLEHLVMRAMYFLRDHDEYHAYLTRRGFDRADIERYELGYWDGWYTIPVKTEFDNYQTIIFRAGPWIQEQTGQRYFQIRGHKPCLYIPDWSLLDNSKRLYVTFGMFDAISLAKMGYAACTGTGGQGVFDKEWVSFWRMPIQFFPDRDEEDKARHFANQLGWRGTWLNYNYPVGCKDPNDLYVNDNQNLSEMLARHNQEIPA